MTRFEESAKNIIRMHELGGASVSKECIELLTQRFREAYAEGRKAGLEEARGIAYGIYENHRLESVEHPGALSAAVLIRMRAEEVGNG
jgi:hypothetical protein